MNRLFVLLALFAASPAAAQGFDPFHEARIENRLGAQIPLDAPLRDADGHPTTLRLLAQGQPIVLAPVLHRCPNLCGVTLSGLARAVAAQKGTPGRDFVVVAFGIDPREGPDAAREDLGRLSNSDGSIATGFHAVVGSPASVSAVTDAAGYHYAWDRRIGQYAHAAGVAVLGADGRLVQWLYGVAPSPQALASALDHARTEAPASWTAPLLLLCYHYDPLTGRYTLAITRLLQLAALFTLIGIAILWLRFRGAHR